jgi:hypothetical protein
MQLVHEMLLSSIVVNLSNGLCFVCILYNNQHTGQNPAGDHSFEKCTPMKTVAKSVHIKSKKTYKGNYVFLWIWNVGLLKINLFVFVDPLVLDIQLVHDGYLPGRLGEHDSDEDSA